MASMNTRLNIEKLDGNIVQKHGGSKKVGFKQLGPCVKTGVHGVHVQKCVWFEVELQGAQKNREDEVIQESHDHAAVAQRKLKVKKLEGKTNMNCLVNKQVHHGANIGAVIMKTGVHGQEGAEGNAAERYRGDNNMAALGMQLLVRRSSDDSNIYYWKYAPGMFIYLFLYIDYMGFTCESKAEILVTKGLLDEAKEIILEGGLSGNRDEEKKSKGSCIYALASHMYQIVYTRPDIASANVAMLNGRGLQTNVHWYGFIIHECAVSWEVILQHIMALLTTEAKYMTLAKKLKEDTWLKRFSAESGFELKLVAGIATCALTKVVPNPRFQHWLKLLCIVEG
ncbi:hypothetical protein Tco_0173210 [Tanacetum coccineum]